MPRNIHPELMNELSASEIRITHLMIIDLDEIGGGSLYFTNHDQDVPFFDQYDRPVTYTPLAFKVGRVENTTDSKFAQVKLTLDNVTDEFSTLVQETDIEGSDVVVYQVSLNKLDRPYLKVEIFNGILDKPIITEGNFEITVISAPEVRVVRVPRRLYRRRCQWVFGAGWDTCPYGQSQGQQCAKSYEACFGFGMKDHFGGFRKIPQIADVRGANG